jgi:hypothetical protein
LARSIVRPDNPLTARVAVNRVWHHLFGRGIVPTVDNFGVLGQPPTHPQLLDHLADQFVRDGWSIKRLIRRLVTSSTYQMSSRPSVEGDAKDPGNELLHRMRIRRLEAEVIRDAILAVSGRLDRTAFGPSVPVHVTSFMQGRGRPASSGPMDGNGRRSVYLEVRRNFLSPMMLAFDAPVPFSTMGRRNVSNVPAQALILMNDPFVIEQSRVWARRLLALDGQSMQQRIGQMYEEAFARSARTEEIEDAVAFIRQQARHRNLQPGQAERDEDVWTDLCHVMFNVKEFVFID